MCGRFTQYYTWAEIHQMYSIVPATPRNLQPRYNISPTQTVGVITRNDTGEMNYSEKRWWLIPNWWKQDKKKVPSTFNVRSETIDEKPMFRSAFKTSRCLIPASGFFEWTGPKEARLPWYMTSPDGRPLTFAGLHDTWRDPENGETVESCTIVVTGANVFMGEIHDRMPVVLHQDDWSAWLDAPRKDLLRSAPEETLRAWRVTPEMNSSRFQDASAVEPIAA